MEDVMNKWRVFVVAVLWATSLLGVGLWAQVGKEEPPVLVTFGSGSRPVLSGENIGFRPIPDTNGEKPGTISGRLVVKVNGVWLDAVAPVSFQLVPARP
jgi:hypothetical protein